ncbi:hypothetical protein [Bradyrhizobium liaoningense]|uniref:hypothetical protein n=1 Tax=Bradyrhizobium liaoningense TaxID=43992 RepID=UPI0004AFAE38|nr:hypothetical protein [Bradyrhizobium liaoningense]
MTTGKKEEDEYTERQHPGTHHAPAKPKAGDETKPEGEATNQPQPGIPAHKD